MENLGMERLSPAAEAVDHVRFQISLLRLCAVPDLATSVKPEFVVAPSERETPHLRELEFMTEVAR